MDIAYYEQRLRREPNSVVDLASLARQLQQIDDHARAAELLTRAVELDPKDADLFVALGISLAALDRPADAVTRYQRAIEIAPRHSQAHNNLGNAYRALGETAKAVPHFEQALSSEPDNASTHNNAGIAYKELGRHRRAIDHLRRAVELDDDNALFHANLGNALRESGQDAPALAAYETAMRLRPGWPTPMNWAAWVLATSADEAVRDPARAQALAEQAARATQFRNPDTLDTLAAAQAALGRYDAALQTLDRAIELAQQAKLADKLPAMRQRRERYASGRGWDGD
jgi:tetratricopeptide (TPR) repeat protein